MNLPKLARTIIIAYNIMCASSYHPHDLTFAALLICFATATIVKHDLIVKPDLIEPLPSVVYIHE